jgi:phosphoglucomutase
LRNFATEDFIDVEGDPIPKENMLIFELVDGRRVAVRPSGTEPKIKFYLFAKQDTTAGKKFGAQELANLKVQVRDSLERLWAWIQQDAAHRAK